MYMRIVFIVKLYDANISKSPQVSLLHFIDFINFIPKRDSITVTINSEFIRVFRILLGYG